MTENVHLCSKRVFYIPDFFIFGCLRCLWGPNGGFLRLLKGPKSASKEESKPTLMSSKDLYLVLKALKALLTHKY